MLKGKESKSMGRKYRLTEQGHRRQVTQGKERFKWLRHPIFQLVTFLISLGAATYGTLTWMEPSRFPVTTVEVVGEISHVDKKEIYQIVTPEIRHGFFGVSVNRLQAKMVALPWIKSTAVKRVWPGKLIIVITEEIPIAYWNSDSLLNQSGQIFSPPQSTFPSGLPKLIGPEGKESQVLEQFLKMSKTLSPLALTIAKVELAPRGAWYLSLSNGIDVILGTDEITERLNRFVSSYNKVLSQSQIPVRYVDMRYTNGMAVGWKTG